MQKTNITDGWLSGFIDGDGCFYCYISKASPASVSCSLLVKQSTHDVAVLAAIKDYLGSGSLKPARKDDSL